MPPFFENDYAKIIVDDFPIIRIYLTEKSASEEILDEYLGSLKDVMMKGKHFQIYIPSKSFKLMSSQQRIKTGKFIKENEELSKKNLIATAVVVSNMLVKLVMDGVMLISPSLGVLKTFKTLEKAEEWIQQELQKAKEGGVIE